MNQAEEDALELKITDDVFGAGEWVDIRVNEAIRLAIRAAVAHERERAAKVCEQEWDRSGVDACAISCARAIRRGE